MKKVFGTPLIPYLLAALFTLAAIAIRASLSPFLDDHFSLVTLFPAIAGAVWLGGYRSAMIPVFLGYFLCDYFFALPFHGPSITTLSGFVGFLIFLFSAGFLVWFGESMRRNRSATRDQRELLRVTLASIGDAVITTNLQSHVTSMNPTAEALTGWRGDEAMGRELDDVFQIENQESGVRGAKRLLRGFPGNDAISPTNHTLLRNKSGNETPIDYNAAPIRDAVGNLVGGVLIFRDMLKRSAMEQALRQSEERHRFLADLAMATQNLVDPDEIMATTARMVAVHLKADRCAYAEIEDESVFVVTGDYSPDVPSIVGRLSVAGFGPELERLMLENKPYVIDDVEIDPRAGTNLEAYRQTLIRSVICVPLHKAGRFTAAMAVHQTTPRHWTEDEIELVQTVVSRCWESLERAWADRCLKQTADRLLLALDAARLGDWSWDPVTDIVDVSEKAGEILGIPPGKGTTWTELQELIHVDDRERARKAVNEAVAARSQYDVEYRVRRSGPGEGWVSAKGRAHYDAAGNAVGMFGVVQDIADRKRLENDLRRHAAELAEADKKKDNFIALLAHELRNPLAPIRTGLEVMRMAEGKPEIQTKSREMMERQLNHMVRLVDDLLDVSRIASNKLLLQTEPLLLSEVIEHAVESSKPLLNAAGHTLRLLIPDFPIVLQGDLTRLTQVFGNLLGNSAKFSQNGSVIELTASTHPGRVAISVRDNGIGIPESDLPRIFEMFAQVDRSGTKGGLGIGLGLVKALVEMHGGSVSVASDGPGKGSTFSVTLPMVEEKAVTRGPLRDPGGKPSILSGLRVLLADDNRDGAASLAQLLSIMGGQVETAVDGVEAVTACDTRHPDLILMDLGMPRMGGLDATRQIRSRPWGREPIIIALTGWGRDDDRDRSRAAGCDGHLVKPVSVAELEELLVQLRPRTKLLQETAG